MAKKTHLNSYASPVMCRNCEGESLGAEGLTVQYILLMCRWLLLLFAVVESAVSKQSFQLSRNISSNRQNKETCAGNRGGRPSPMEMNMNSLERIK